MTQNNIEIAFDIPNTESIYLLKATKGNFKRFYNFKSYELLQQIYTQRSADGWMCEVIIK